MSTTKTVATQKNVLCQVSFHPKYGMIEAWLHGCINRCQNKAAMLTESIEAGKAGRKNTSRTIRCRCARRSARRGKLCARLREHSRQGSKMLSRKSRGAASGFNPCQRKEFKKDRSFKNMGRKKTKGKGTAIIPSERIESKIFFIRGKKVMFDRDLASLYGVTTGRLNEQVKRNRKRFPDDDFMFPLTKSEFENFKGLISQNAISKRGFWCINSIL
jgi:ORF6N domain